MVARVCVFRDVKVFLLRARLAGGKVVVTNPHTGTTSYLAMKDTNPHCLSCLVFDNTISTATRFNTWDKLSAWALEVARLYQLRIQIAPIGINEVTIDYDYRK